MKIILSHRYHDFDALASMVAARMIYPDAVLVLEGTSGSSVQDFLALAKEHLPYYRLKDLDLSKVEKIILVDTNDISRAIGSSKIMESLNEIEIEIIDHHPYSGPKSDNIIIHMVGACTTILVERIISKGLKISSFDATLMALGIYDDTGSLLFENTTPRDLMAVACLLEQGAQLGVLSDYLRRPLSEEQMDLFQQLLDNGSTENFEGTPVYLSFAICDEYISGLSLLAHRLGEIENADVWFIVVKMEKRVFVVGRSRGDSLPVNSIVEVFGGAGHTKAASAVVREGEIKPILERLKTEIRLRVEKPHQIRDIMSYPVKTIFPETTIQEAANTLLRYGHTGVPVIKDNRLAGVISRRDIDKALKHGLQHAPVKGFMTKEVITVSPGQSWEEVQKLMVLHDIGRVPVLDQGELVGIVSRSDVLSLVYRSVVPTTADLVRQRGIARQEETLAQIRKLPECQLTVLEKAKEVASQTGNSVYLVGGFVRDLLLGVPTTDLDIVVEGDGIAFAKRLSSELQPSKLTLHEPFGTARLLFDNGTHLDIAGTRREDYDYPGALPVVEGSSLKDDLFRRDFTINSMALCLNPECFGEVIDYYGGLRDLQQGELRFLHNLSFIDDPTRILRAIRFAGRYGFKLAKVTGDAISTALEAEVFTKISAERFTEELMLIYSERNYQVMGQKLTETGVFSYWFKADLKWNYSEQEDVTLWPLEKRWLISLKNIDYAGVIHIMKGLRLTKNLRTITLEYLELREKLLLNNNDNPTKTDEILSDVPKMLLEVLASHNELAPAIKSYIIALSKTDMRVTGNDLIKSGIGEGPVIGDILKEIRKCWLDGRIKNKIEEEEYLKELILKHKSESGRGHFVEKKNF